MCSVSVHLLLLVTCYHKPTKKKPSHEVIRSRVLDQRKRRAHHGDDDMWRRPEGVSSFLLSTGDHSNPDSAVTSTDPRVSIVCTIP